MALPLTIPGIIQYAADRYGEASAIEDGDAVLSFADLALSCRNASAALVHGGIQPGDRVAIWAPNIKEWIIAAVGVQGAGAVIVPLNTRMKGREAGDILRRARVKMLLTVAEFQGQAYPGLIRDEDLPDLERIVLLAGQSQGCDFWSDMTGSGRPGQDWPRVSPDDLSDIIFTSGTTGLPKGVMTTHSQTVRTAELWADSVGLRAGDRYLIVNPFFHSFGYKAGWLAAILVGATILPQAVFDVTEILRRAAAEKVTVLPGAPTIYQSILAHPDYTQADLSSLRLAVTGAATIPVSLIHDMWDKLGFETVVTGYGLTEATGVVTMCRPEDDAETIANTSGKAVEGVELRCVDADGNDVPVGEPGEVIVRGFNIMQGYLDDPDATREAIDEDGWLHTGDIAVMNDRGYIKITDRMKDMFITGGFNCYPAEIENIMAGHADIAQVAVIGMADERLGEVAKAYVVRMPDAVLDAASLTTWCRDNMANYKVPRAIVFVDALPVNASGKVQKFKLSDLG